MRHFKGNYWSLDPWMSRKATRIVRNTGIIRSTVDCCDFMAEGVQGMLKSGPHGRLIKARIFHYGWVKDPEALKRKLEFQISRHDGEHLTNEEMALQAYVRSQFPTYSVLKEYRETHPGVMAGRIARGRRLRPRINRWLTPAFYREIFKHGFKG